MKVLVLNSGSSSIKFQLFDLPGERVLAAGLVEKIGEASGSISYRQNGTDGHEQSIQQAVYVVDHDQGLSAIVGLLMDPEHGVIASTAEVDAVGHRVVHGGDKFSKPTVIQEDMINELKRLSHLAPLHNPACMQGIAVAQQHFTSARQVAVFDTAFHQTMPEYAYRYAIPKYLHKEHGLRAYGFHGTSHGYVMKTAAHFLQLPPDQFNAITVHLGNGCSIAAIRNGQCVDTSMGLTPLAGLIMGTRSGDIDPSLLLFLGDHLDMSFTEIDQLLNKKSGLKALAGTNDLRAIIQKYDEGDPQARLAIAMYTYRIKKYIGAYAVALGRLDAIIFTAGVGENSALVREWVCRDMSVIGVALDEVKNQQVSGKLAELQRADSLVKVLVVPTNEELEIARQTFEVLQG